MNEEQLKIGDVVKLKSGGTLMTIREFYRDSETRTDKNRVWCDWNIDNEPYRENYYINELELIKNPK